MCQYVTDKFGTTVLRDTLAAQLFATLVNGPDVHNVSSSLPAIIAGEFASNSMYFYLNTAQVWVNSIGVSQIVVV